MRSGMQVCRPDQLKVLQQIFDCVWLQLKEDPNFHCIQEKELRLMVSRQVIAYSGRDLFDVDGIKSKVLRSLAASSTVTRG